jgi:HAD superfamily phosphoserine phosphatase-like hydrolase
MERDSRPQRSALVVFDLDGTLLRGQTVCELLAGSLGRLERMQQLERFVTNDDLRAGREEMATWYRPVGIARLRDTLGGACLAPGAEEGLRLLRRQGVAIGIASITWSFAVEHFARLLDVEHWLGTALEASGEIRHVWAEDKASWVRELALRLNVPFERTAAVGDSIGDREMLEAVGTAVFIGRELPAPRPRWLHFPSADITSIAERLLSAWQLSPTTSPGPRCAPAAELASDGLAQG